MGLRENKVSGRRKILQLLKDYPEGLNAAKIRQIVMLDYPVSEEAVAKALVRLTTEEKIINTGKGGCPSCALRSVIYRLRQIPLPLPLPEQQNA